MATQSIPVPSLDFQNFVTNFSYNGGNVLQPGQIVTVGDIANLIAKLSVYIDPVNDFFSLEEQDGGTILHFTSLAANIANSITVNGTTYNFTVIGADD